ncbi:MAG TPA: hypothetical protein VEU47_19045 [Candidatus Cybelea sp.]|nr:hypothetical protein [Candidatus Cybelea sp.]
MWSKLRKILRNIAVGAVALAAIPAGAAGVSYFTGPGGSNPLNFPVIQGDINTFIQQLNNVIGVLNLNANLNPPMKPEGIIFTTATTASLVGGTTTEGTVASFTLPANALDQPGRKIRVHADFSTANNSNAKTAAIYFNTAGTTLNASLSPVNAVLYSAVGLVSGTINLDMIITQTITANVQTFDGLAISSNNTIAAPTAFSTAGGLTAVQTSPIIITATSKTATGTFADVILDDFSVEYLN